MAEETYKVDKYCSACGKGLIATAVICPQCGSPVPGTKTPGSSQKSRSTAILLSIFLGFWTFLYTYRVDSKKFWAAIIPIGISSVVLTWNEWAWENLWDWYSDDYESTQLVFGTIWALVTIASWIFAIITSVKRTEDDYASL